MVVSMDKWSGKVAIVTGAASGIGAAVADALVENALIVVGVDCRPELVEEHAKTLSNKKGKLHAFKADLRKEEDILSLFKWTTKNLGPVHILVNCAGIGSAGKPFTSGKPEEWRALFDVNVMGVCIAINEAVKIMKENKINGHIVNMNSLAGHQVVNIPGLNVYAASKHAITALTETLRQEFNHLGLKIKITSVSPGFVATEMTLYNKNNTPERVEFLKSMPFLKAEDIADGIIYALSTPEHVQVHELTIRPLGEKY
ncbi:hypothetical protein Zmor_017625 [Zophobas morio]|uniref:Dehydrogenase/reductase SDR family member 11 n=1 Tax=Zophobas morio TaxID=2755281 RepID=A0AA38IBP2_9CUCU|nr:hypothetical protein Zmor_017625 [Zophobas morio]